MLQKVCFGDSYHHSIDDFFPLQIGCGAIKHESDQGILYRWEKDLVHCLECMERNVLPRWATNKSRIRHGCVASTSRKEGGTVNVSVTRWGREGTQTLLPQTSRSCNTSSSISEAIHHTSWLLNLKTSLIFCSVTLLLQCLWLGMLHQHHMWWLKACCIHLPNTSKQTLWVLVPVIS